MVKYLKSIESILLVYFIYSFFARSYNFANVSIWSHAALNIDNIFDKKQMFKIKCSYTK